MWPAEKVARYSSNVDYFGMHYAALLQTDLHSLVKPGHCFKIFQKMYIWIYGMYKIQKVPVIYFCIYEKMLTDCSQFLCWLFEGVVEIRILPGTTVIRGRGTKHHCCCNTKLSSHSSSCLHPKTQKMIVLLFASFCVCD